MGQFDPVVGQFNYGRITGLNREATRAYLMNVRAATIRDAEKSRAWLGCRYFMARWRNGSNQGFITEYDAVEWIAEHEYPKATPGNTE